VCECVCGGRIQKVLVVGSPGAQSIAIDDLLERMT
jgi:hypothetical protein